MTRRLLETIAMLMIGDSVLALISPSRHVSLWTSGPRWWERTFEPLVYHPRLTRALGALGLVLGVWLAWRQEPAAPRRLRGNLGRNGRRWPQRLAEAMQ